MRPNTKYRIVEICSITLFIDHLRNFKIGSNASNPPYVKNKKGIWVDSEGDEHQELCIYKTIVMHLERQGQEAAYGQALNASKMKD